MKKTTDLIVSLLKDFYSDRDSYNQHASPFESTMEIYEKHAKRIYERLLEKCEGKNK